MGRDEGKRNNLNEIYYDTVQQYTYQLQSLRILLQDAGACTRFGSLLRLKENTEVNLIFSMFFFDVICVHGVINNNPAYEGSCLCQQPLLLLSQPEQQPPHHSDSC
jgi:hypothetical protein